MSYTLTVCVDLDRDGSYAGPLSTNRITNGDFASGETGWTFLDGAQHSVSAGKLHLYRNGGSFASAYQDFAYVTNNGDQFTITWKVANPSAASKTYQISLHASTGVAEWINVPYTLAAGAAETPMSLTVSAALTTPWLVTRFEIYVVSDDNTDGLIFDDIVVTTTHAKDDITAYVIDGNTTAGFSQERNHLADIGQAFFTLDNGDRRFSPSYAAGPYYGKLLPNTPVQVTATVGATTYILWTGVVKRLSPQAGSGGQRRAVMVCEDNLSRPQMESIDLTYQTQITADRLMRLITSLVWRGDLAALTVTFQDQLAAGDLIGIYGYLNQFEKVYRFVASLTPAANEVLIGATKEATAANFVAALNNDPDLAGTGYANSTSRNPLLSAGEVAAGTAHTGGTLTITASGGLAIIGDVAGRSTEQLQVFSPSDSGILSQIKVTHGANNGSPVGTVTWYIFPGPPASSYPPYQDVKGQALKTGTYTPTASAENTINVTNGPFLLAGTNYGLWIAPTAVQGADVYWTWLRSTTSVYGTAVQKLYESTNEGHSWSSSTVDACMAVTTSASTDATILLTALARGAEANAITVDDVGTSRFAGGTLAGGTDAPAGLLATQTGDRTFELAGDTWNQESVNAWQALAAVVEAEFGWLWAARDGTLTLKNRFFEFQAQIATPALTLTDGGTRLDGELNDYDLVNRVSVSYVPKAQTSAGVVAQSLGPIEVPGLSFAKDATIWPRNNRALGSYSGTKTQPAGKPTPGDKIIRLPYTDASGIRMGARDLITPVAGTDYTVNDAQDGSGFDYTAAPPICISVSIAPGGSDVEVALKNSATGPLYLFDFQVRGTAIRTFSPETLTVTDDVSIAAYGTHPTDYALDLGSDVVFAEAIGYYLLARYSTPRHFVHELEFAGPEVVGGVNILALEIGDVIVLTDTQTGITAQRAIIRAIDYLLAQGGQMVNARLTLKPLEAYQVAILDDAVYGVLDAANCLGL